MGSRNFPLRPELRRGNGRWLSDTWVVAHRPEAPLFLTDTLTEGNMLATVPLVVTASVVGEGICTCLNKLKASYVPVGKIPSNRATDLAVVSNFDMSVAAAYP